MPGGRTGFAQSVFLVIENEFDSNGKAGFFKVNKIRARHKMEAIADSGKECIRTATVPLFKGPFCSIFPQVFRTKEGAGKSRNNEGM